MTNFQSHIRDLESADSGAPATAGGTGSFFAMSLLQAIAEQTIILKRINSKLWKINQALSEESSDLAQYQNSEGDQ